MGAFDHTGKNPVQQSRNRLDGDEPGYQNLHQIELDDLMLRQIRNNRLVGAFWLVGIMACITLLFISVNLAIAVAIAVALIGTCLWAAVSLTQTGMSKIDALQSQVDRAWY